MRAARSISGGNGAGRKSARFVTHAAGMANTPKLLTGWQADKLGLFQGTPSSIGEAVDAMADKLRKRKVPRLEPATSRHRWEEGKPYKVDEAELEEMKRNGELPTNVTYEGNNADAAEKRAEKGTHAIVYMLDTVAKLRRVVMIHGNVLVAVRDDWERTRGGKS